MVHRLAWVFNFLQCERDGLPLNLRQRIVVRRGEQRYLRPRSCGQGILGFSRSLAQRNAQQNFNRDGLAAAYGGLELPLLECRPGSLVGEIFNSAINCDLFH